MSREEDRVSEYLRLIKPISLGMQFAGGIFVALAWIIADPTYKYDADKLLAMLIVWVLSLFASWKTRYLSYFSIFTVWLTCYGFSVLIEKSPDWQYWSAVLSVALSLLVAPVYYKLREYIIAACGSWLIFGKGWLLQTPQGGDVAWTWLLLISILSVGAFLNIIFANIHRKSLELRDELAHLAFTDALTGIDNRRKFMEDIERICASISEGEGHFLMIDIDNFKRINDDFGHPKGDEILQGLAKILSKTAASEPVGRVGGEEFGMLLTSGGVKRVEAVSREIMDGIQSLEAGGRVITVSIGVARVKAGQSLPGLIKQADACLYEAKNLGKNRMVIA